MLKRVFLGYDSPFLPKLVERLLSSENSLARTLVIVPTSQSGRTLRESLAASASALLSPTVSTPGALLHLDDPTIAPRWLEKIAWIETLDTIKGAEWANYHGLFPSPPNQDNNSSDWSTSLASELVALRSTLEEHLHNLFTASKFLNETPEAARWNDLAKLETLMEQKLFAWGYQSRSTALRAGFHLPEEYEQIILAGITEMPPCLAKALTEFDGEVIAWVAAPEAEQDHFSELGLPLENWTHRKLPTYAKASISSDPASQAQAALDSISASGLGSTQIALGSADDQTGSALAHVLTAAGWTAFHPATRQPLPPIVRWLRAWKEWLSKPDSRRLAALLTFPQVEAFLSGTRVEQLLLFNQLRDRNPTIEPAQLINKIATSEKPQYQALHTSISDLLKQRQQFLDRPFSEILGAHLKQLQINAKVSIDSQPQIEDFLESATPLMKTIKRSHLFWLQVLLSEIPASPAQPPTDRVIDIQGWLELLYEPGEHLVICGMNETFVPARCGGEPWLSENIRETLGLNSDTVRHARDAFLLHAMIHMRENQGSTHLFCGKNGNEGETYLPSRLLLQVPKDQLILTVTELFKEIEPPEGNLIWKRDWKWQTPKVELPTHLSVTTLRDYLACPFRFYLKHLAKASQPEPDRREMNARDFGYISHNVLEKWGLDTEARLLSDPQKLTAYFDAELEATIFRKFGKNPPLAVRIQVHSIKQRLSWFALQQAATHAEGWEVVHAERKISIESTGFTVRGQIDRIDRHRDTGQLRVIDYKTGSVNSTEGEHRTKISAKTRIPAHILENDAPFHEITDAKGKTASYLWKNLQLPIYALAENIDSNGEIPIPCYVQLGKTKESVNFTEWSNFNSEDLESAKSAMNWITERILKQSFWPPSEKVSYDDYAVLYPEALMQEAFTQP